MYERVSNCPICDNDNLTNFLICQDHSVSSESFAITECHSCRFRFTNPRPDTDSIQKYYESKNYISHTTSSTNLIDIVYKLARFFTIRFKYRIINKYNKKGKILDFGCGTGSFLEYCKKNGWNAVGIEPNQTAKLESEKLDLPIYSSLYDLQAEEKFDVITLWHVLEHVHELKETVEKLKKRLTKNGIICVAVPNSHSFDCNYYKEYWAGYDVPRHLSHFTQDTFGSLLKKTKLKLIEIHPMKLDAFYVSMLSEKYKKGRNSFFEAFQIGLKSNRWAHQNNNNYSSLIYIVKK